MSSNLAFHPFGEKYVWPIHSLAVGAVGVVFWETLDNHIPIHDPNNHSLFCS